MRVVLRSGRGVERNVGFLPFVSLRRASRPFLLGCVVRSEAVLYETGAIGTAVL